MQGKPPSTSPADIAREAFRRLATQRIAPTPDAYRAAYEEVAGIASDGTPELVLTELAATLTMTSQAAADLAEDVRRAVEQRDWQRCLRQLTAAVEKVRTQAETELAAAAEQSTPAPAAIAAAPVRPPAPVAATNGSALNPIALTEVDRRDETMLRDLLARTLALGVASLLRSRPALAAEAEALAASVRDSEKIRLDEIASRLKQLCFRIEAHSEDMAEEHEMLLRLFRLLLENVSELLEDDSWLGGQIDNVQKLLDGPISQAALEDAMRSLKEVIYKQGMLKHSLAEAKNRMKDMMITFIDRIGVMAASTGDYHKKIGQYSKKISGARNVNELNTILDDVMRDTKAVHDEALRSRDEMVVARQEVQEAESRIHELETKLEQLSELVREDQLTGSLNRRGLEDVFEKEIARSERKKTPLCVALLDLDDFKRLNDTYGHHAGDGALIHVVKVVKDTLRTMDVIARFGGEEFLIVLPDTGLEDAIQTVTRVQRELTKRIFLHENARLLITFSAGVALRESGESTEALIKRADAALYGAKKAGKNRVVAAG